jgi:UDP-N-acetylglucosamine--N-acetylmuramyl-(pentapeptide) pyrophosphoryl-undecaprenol N-acetylglucosamine transferase
VIGGSLGARTLNESMMAGLQQLIDADVQLIWQIGKFYYQNIFERLKSYDETNIRPLEFIREMDKAYSAADVVISRAGALSVSELSLVEKPVIFVPSPNVAEDHQTKNAQALAEHDAAWMIKDKEAVEKLVPTALQLLQNEQEQQKLKENIAKLARPDAAEDIAKEVLNLIA